MIAETNVRAKSNVRGNDARQAMSQTGVIEKLHLTLGSCVCTLSEFPAPPWLSIPGAMAS